jgi:hypothetical protein
MGGVKEIWRKSKSNIGLDLMNMNNKNKKEDKDKALKFRKSMTSNLEKAEQQYNDQKLELFTYASGLKQGMEKVARGLADKICQGQGPYLVKFKDTPEKVIILN